MLALASPARAQPADGAPAPAPTSDQADARAHFERGKELHAKRMFREAAAEYLAAFEKYPAPAFLYNVGQVYRLAGDRKKALEHYKRYLELEPDGEGSADARAFIAELEAQLAAEAKSGRRVAPPAQIPDDPDDRPLAPDEARPPVSRDDDGSGGGGYKIGAAIAGGIGLVTIAGAVYFGLEARAASDDLSTYEGEWTPAEEKRYDEGQQAERLMNVSLIAAGAAVVAGGVLLFLGVRADRIEREQLAVAPSTDGFGAVVLLGGSL